MNYNYFPVIFRCSLLVVIIASCHLQPGREKMADYPITPVPFTDVHFQDDFWLPRIITNSQVTIPIAFRQSEETGRIKNFEVAGGLSEGTFSSTYPFDDSDVFKIMEGAAYALMVKPDQVLEAYLDSLIYKISKAQEEDGYLYTNRTILGENAHEWAGAERWQHESEHSHELYNVGHMYEAAVAHNLATGKRSFLDIALKNADLIAGDFGWGKVEKYPGHQEIEIGLVKLYRVTGDEKYLNLAKFFLDIRGPGGWEYNQAHMRVADQRMPVGHAVRALYMYAGMADVTALTGDQTYLEALHSIWDNIVDKKFYITGGIGQTGGNEGFGADYDLPNATAYCETCAAIANVFWNHRMFLLTGDAKYIDVLERTLYNGLLSGVSLSGDRFFYPNPLESDGKHERAAWFGCACCPSNICRFLPSVPGYVYAKGEEEIFINLFIASETELEVNGRKISLSQATNYPWDGNIRIAIHVDRPFKQKISLRIPGWAQDQPVPGDLYTFSEPLVNDLTITVNGQAIDYKIIKGFAVIDRQWKSGDQIALNIPMSVQKLIAHEAVLANKDRFAIQRGPLVYCLEETDNPGSDVREVRIDQLSGLDLTAGDEILGGLKKITFSSQVMNVGEGITVQEHSLLTAIPYAFWANREPGTMAVWIRSPKSQTTSMK